MSGALLVRPACPDDAAAIAGICTRAARAAYADLVTDDYLTRVIDHFFAIDRLVQEVAPGPGWFGFTVAEEGAHVLAAAGTGASAEHAGACELFALYVDPSAQRRGLGRVLVADAVSAASRAGASRLDVAVMPGNEPARRFYQACGFNFAGQRPVYAPHGPEGGPQMAAVYARQL